MARYQKKVVLLILDGWGLAKADKYNAIENANTPNIDRLIRDYPNISLRADGGYVGLPEGQFGTSEINHQVIGTGQVLKQDLPKIDDSIKDGTFFRNEELIQSFEHTKKHNSSLHLVGILSDGKVHCSIHHVLNLVKFAAQEKVENLFFHIFTDGRDAPPQSASKYIDMLMEEVKKYKFKTAKIATLQGRFYLDRDRDWNKTEKAVDLMVRGKGKPFNSAKSAVNYNYNHNTTDEFIDQVLIDKEGLISENDSVVFFHYRTDRMYQIQKKVLEEKFQNLNLVSFVQVLESKKVNIAFPRNKISKTLAKVISDAGKKQYHVTETEKYAHLTFFLNAGREEEYPGEHWEMIKSNRFFKPFYNFVPSMKVDEIASKIVKEVEQGSQDFIIANFTNADMVGHTGNYEAAKVAVESVDYSVGKVYESIKDRKDEYALIVTADHGNSDIMWDYENDQPHTQHTTSPVPFILVSDIRCKLDRKESLEDVAPTVLDLLGIEKPEVMTGSSLIIEI